MSVITFPAQIASSSSEPLHVVPGPDKPSGATLIDLLKQDILKQKADYRTDLIAHIKSQLSPQPADLPLTDDQIWADIEGAEGSGFADLVKHVDGDGGGFVAKALQRCNTFSPEENNSYPVL